MTSDVSTNADQHSIETRILDALFDLYQRRLRALVYCPLGIQKVAILWLEGWTSEKIANETRNSLRTIARRKRRAAETWRQYGLW